MLLRFAKITRQLINSKACEGYKEGKGHMPVARQKVYSAAVTGMCVQCGGSVLSIHVQDAGAQLLFKAKGWIGSSTLP